jgi:peroxiredoxin
MAYCGDTIRLEQDPSQGAPGAEAEQVAADLQGRKIPSTIEEFLVGRHLPRILREKSCVVYFYPGRSSTVGEAVPWVREDEAQHRAFRRHRDDLAAYDVTPVGISSESHHVQVGTAFGLNLDHPLFSDRELMLAQELGLPTLSLGERRFYRRVTLVTRRGGYVEKVFYPVQAAQNAAQVCAWLYVHRRAS